MSDATRGTASAGLLVIGSGPAGVAAAVAYRDAGGTGAVRILTADEHLPYNRPPLSKDLLRGETHPDDVWLHPADFYADRDIEIVRSVSVSALDPAGGTATLDDGRIFDFARCVIATGARPVRPPIPGNDGPTVHALRTLTEALTLREAAENARSAVVVGSGFIGCEAAASLARRGLHVTLVTTEDQPQAARLGPQVAERIAGWLRADGVELVTGDGLAEITADLVRTESGREIPADRVLLATGVEPRVELAQRAGLRTTEGRVRVDDAMRTSAANVFAAGDVALATNAVAGRPVAVEHWGDALTMGDIAGRVAAGALGSWAEAPGFWSSIGDRALKYVAWGDGYDEAIFRAGPGESFTAWYVRAGRIVGVLTHEADDDYERGRQLVGDGIGVEALG